MRASNCVYFVLLALVVVPCQANAQAVEPSAAVSDTLRPFEEVVVPVLNRYCVDCHGASEPDAKLDLSRFQSTEHLSGFPELWQEVSTRIAEGEMPPEDAEPLADEERQKVIDWLAAWRSDMAARNAGDPGVVLTRRLNTAEYNYTLRDLLGVDIRPAREFPVDPANEAGFDNSGQSLAMSPGLLNKYLAAARTVAEHAVLTPQGIDFAPHPVMTETDRDKYAVNRIVDFYSRQPTQIADYLLAAWKLQHAEPEQEGTHSPTLISQVAADSQLSEKYLTRLVDTLHAAERDGEPNSEQKGEQNGEPSGDAASSTLPILDWLRTEWRQEVLSQVEPDLAEKACQQLAQQIQAVRDALQPSIVNLEAAGIHKGSQTFVLWKNRQYARNRQRYVPEHLDGLEKDKLPEEIAALLTPPSDEQRGDEQVGNKQGGNQVNNVQRREYDRQMAEFCEVFPDAFYISERGRDYLDTPREKQEKGRLLSAGFHSMMGYFRDDAPLVDLILADSERAELDALWQELDFITEAPIRQYLGFLWFERTDSRYMRDEEFDFARAEDKQSATGPMIRKLAKVYIDKAERGGAEGDARQALVEYFEQIEQEIAWVEQAQQGARPRHLMALTEFGRRAFRGNWTADDERDLRTFYHSLIDDEGLSHSEAIQDAIVMLLMSPKFVYRVDLNATEEKVTSLNSFELASRLSYFLWSSMPDADMLEVAAADGLTDPQMLLVHTDRLLADPRSRALAVEFGGQWLGFRRFEEHNSVDRQRFPEFTDRLRQAMYEEPIQFLTDMIRNNRSVLECLQADRIFVTSELAKHYGIAVDRSAAAGDPEWHVVESDEGTGRGGLPTMAVFLTQNSPGLRTSPVKRGYWVVRQLLGERIPPPPPGVPELPEDESQLGELSLREVLERHREQASCAVCHDRFDALGLVFENYGPVGELRSVDLAGKPVDTSATFPDGSVGHGVEDLQAYLLEERRDDFIDNLCKKLLAFALGRTLQISDDSLLAAMRENLERDNFQFSSLIRTIIASPQFTQKRS
jgi:hypothetical protein